MADIERMSTLVFTRNIYRHNILWGYEQTSNPNSINGR